MISFHIVNKYYTLFPFNILEVVIAHLKNMLNQSVINLYPSQTILMSWLHFAIFLSLQKSN